MLINSSSMAWASFWVRRVMRCRQERGEGEDGSEEGSITLLLLL